uniref:hypothetical protein n=1 Tax=Klebsiella pneumoniae TaxID=573 RepID=UPI0019532A14
KTPRQTSSVRSRFIEMELEIDTGRMSGRFVAGSLAGQTSSRFRSPGLSRPSPRSMPRALPYSKLILTAETPPG